jgi:hypothetical protein
MYGGMASPAMMATQVDVLQVMDRRVCSPQDVADAMGIAVIGVLPNAAGRRMIGANRPTLTHRRMVVRLSAASKSA